MKKADVFPSKYLKNDDLNGKPITVTIERAPLEPLKTPDGKEQNKTVLYFRGTKKALPLNITNWDACAEICGEDTEDWPRHQIELYPTKTQMGGKTVDCIRIRPPAQRQLPKQNPPVEEPPPTDDTNAVIPPPNWARRLSKHRAAGRPALLPTSPFYPHHRRSSELRSGDCCLPST